MNGYMVKLVHYKLQMYCRGGALLHPNLHRDFVPGIMAYGVVYYV